MKKYLLLVALILPLFIAGCKKDAPKNDGPCEMKALILGKWKFESRIVTKYNSTQPDKPATNLTVNFDPLSYIEFTADDKYTWFETYSGTVYRSQIGKTQCTENPKDFAIFINDKGSTVAEDITLLTSTELIFTYDVYNSNEVPVQTVVTRLTKQ